MNDYVHSQKEERQLDKEIAKLELQIRRERRRREKLQGYKQDFDLFSQDNVRILPKESDGGFIPFVMNEAQQLIHSRIEEQRKKTGMVRVIILKARQQGISTYCAARSYWQTSLRDNVSTVVVAHLASASGNLFNMTKNMIYKHPEDTRPKLEKASQNIIKFDGSESSYHVYTAGSPEAGRGSTPTIAHLSEVAFWPHDDKILAGLFQGIATVDGTEIIMESTANGATGEFHRMWDGANEEGEEWNGFLPIFIPWFMTGEYSTKPSHMPEDFTPTNEEVSFADEFGLNYTQLHWRRIQVAKIGEDKFKQEYPSTAHEAFLRSGANVFSIPRLVEHKPMRPIQRKGFFAERRCFDEVPQGGFEIFEYPSHKKGYVVGADVALGVGGAGDFSVGVVMDEDECVVAIYRENEIDPGTFGDALYFLGLYYNTALLVVEANGYGTSTINTLQKLRYNNLFTEKVNRTGAGRIGFTTSVASKPKIIGHLQRSIIDDTIRLSSNRIIHEMMNFVQRESGRMEASGDNKDDCVIATALCLEGMHEQRHRIKPSGPFDGIDWKPDDTLWI